MTMNQDTSKTLAGLTGLLMAQFNPDRPWSGQLSSSAVATAVAVTALAAVDRQAHRSAIRRGLDWLMATQRSDGGWGDSPESPTNFTATLLVRFACHAAGSPEDIARCEPWLGRELGSWDSHAIRKALASRYGRDLTFSAPILAMGAASGALGAGPGAWAQVPQLPFELAALPPAWFRKLRLTVVSYALPALVAVGLARHRLGPATWSLPRLLRNAATRRVLDLAARMQPSNGGFEEATPLTGFVALCLAHAGLADHVIVRRGVAFLLASQREDGSWPIDTDLATWLTAHAVQALIPAPPTADAAPPPSPLSPHQRRRILDWLLAQQHREIHPLTFGAPGGWGWTDRPGAMPDADDTAAVLIALPRLAEPDAAIRQAASRGLEWLLNLQNADGGIPTFARGWGKLPFDRSCPDLTAHALQAFSVWDPWVEPPLRRRLAKAGARMAAYLAQHQTPDGAWLPLWFGTQLTPAEENPVYGTARTLIALRERRKVPAPYSVDESRLEAMRQSARQYLEKAQNGDGGWGAQPGCRSTIEETALALAALAEDAPGPVTRRGIEWLVAATREGTVAPAAPIGLYFARLWYSETLYPVIFAIHALSSLPGAGSAVKEPAGPTPRTSTCRDDC